MDKPGKPVKKKRPRCTFTPEFKAEAVRLCRVADRSVVQVAKDLDLTETALRRSMSRTGNPWDNAVIERFFRTFTQELLNRERYGGPEQPQRSIVEWFDGSYNPRRRHATIRNMSPIRYELAREMRKRRT